MKALCRPCLTHSTPLLRRLATASIPAKPFTVLALESSADDTAAAVVSSDRVVHSNVVLKQNHVHKHLNGIHPLYAFRAHTASMPFAVSRALADARLTMSDIDGVAFTQGPGMPGCLAVGCNAAKTLAAALGKPLVGVNHMRAHALTVTLTEQDAPPFPHLTLLVSGGHTMLVLVRSEDSYELLAQTLDEAVGETFDQVAVLLGLGWGDRGRGAALEDCASSYALSLSEPQPQPSSPVSAPDPDSDAVITLPLSMRGRIDFSFSGLRGATGRVVDAMKQREGGQLSDRTRAEIAFKFQQQAVAQLEDKLQRAIRTCVLNGTQPKAIVVSGGVASNLYLRERIRIAAHAAHGDTDEGSPIPVYYPPIAMCTDNAVMIAWAAMGRFLTGDTDGYEIMPIKDWKIDMERPKQDMVAPLP